MDVYFRPGLANHHDQARIGHDERVGAERDGRCHVVQVCLEFRAVRVDVGNQIEAVASGMGSVDAFSQDFDVTEIIVADAQRVARLPCVDGGGAEGEGGVQHRQ